MAFFDGFYFLLKILFLGLQWNDPDPYLWMPIYGFVAYVCGMAAVEKYNKTLILIGLSILGFYTLTYIPAFMDWINRGMPNIVETMKADKLYIELTREFGGLIICDLVLIFQYIQAKKNLS